MSIKNQLIYFSSIYSPSEFVDKHSPCKNKDRILILDRNVVKPNIVKIFFIVVILIFMTTQFSKINFVWIKVPLAVLTLFASGLIMLNSTYKVISVYSSEDKYYLERLSFGKFEVQSFSKDKLKMILDISSNIIKIMSENTVLVKEGIITSQIDKIKEIDQISLEY